MILKLWKKPQGRKNVYMINIGESLLSKEPGKTRGILRRRRGRREISHHSLEIVLKDNQF
jgi:hypothetical protein